MLFDLMTGLAYLKNPNKKAKHIRNEVNTPPLERVANALNVTNEIKIKKPHQLNDEVFFNSGDLLSFL